MQKEFDVIALGELLIDFTMHGESEQGNNLLRRVRVGRLVMCSQC